MGQKRSQFRIFIDQRLQVKMAVCVGGMVFGAVLLVWASIEVMIWMMFARAAADPSVVDMLRDLHFYIIYFFFWESLIVSGMSIIATLILSRRIAGPVYRMKEELQQYLDRQDQHGTELRVRTKDEFQELGRLISRLMEEHRKSTAQK